MNFFEHSRTPGLNELEENACHAAWERFCASHVPEDAFDLSVSNATKVGLHGVVPTADEVMPAVLAKYEADPQGIPVARDAVVHYYAEFGVDVDPERVQLFASTSEAVGALIKLVCRPGDEVITFTPTYPLLDSLCSLESVSLCEVPLQDCAREWDIDFFVLEQRCSERTRAVIVVSPNNPTGHCMRRDELAALSHFCASHGLLLIIDEVFAGYRLTDSAELVSQPAAAQVCEGIAVSLSGLSKVCGLPQHKLGWGVFGGDPALIAEAMQRLSYITDSTLSVSGWVQRIAPALIARHDDFSQPCIARLRQNLSVLRGIADRPETRWMLDPVHGGWSACVRLPAWAGGDEACAEFLADHGIRVFPGAFFGYREANPTLVVSLIVEPERFAVAAEKLARLLGGYLD